MNKAVYLALAAALFIPVAAAVNVSIGNVSVNPDNEVWINEQFNITASCTAGSSSRVLYIENLTTSSGPQYVDLDSSDLQFDLLGGSEYILRYDDLEPYLLQPGRYFYDLSCEATSDSGSDSFTGNFTARQLQVNMLSSDTTKYIGDEHQVRLDVVSQPTGQTITRDIDFTVTADGQQLQIQDPTPYLRDGHWSINVSLPVEGTYDLEVIAEHDGGTATASKEITVKEPVSFQASIGTTTVLAGDEVRLDLEAVHKGDTIDISKNDIDIELDGTNIDDRVDETSSGFSITMPEKDPGTYTLDVSVDNSQIQESKEFDIRYPIEVKGAFSNAGGSSIPFSMAFRQDGDKVKEIDGKGNYDDSIVPGDYDLTFTFPHSQLRTILEMEDVSIDEWETPLRYARYNDLDSMVPGIQLAGLYAFRTALDPESITATMNYRTSNIGNPDDLRAFRCDNWNFDKGQCYGTWNEIDADFDRVGSSFTVDMFSMSAYAAGKREQLHVTHSTGQTTFTPNEKMTVSGRVESGRTVNNADITLQIPGTGIEMETQTDRNGVYEFTVPVPNEEDTYTAEITAEKPPYRDGETSLDFNVIRPADLQVRGPDSIEVQANTTRDVELYLENTGFTEIDSVSSFLGSVPFLESVELDRAALQINQSRPLSIHLDIPADAEEKTYTAEATFSYADKNASKVFGITVENPDTKNATAAETESATGMFTTAPSMPNIGSAFSGGSGLTTLLIVGLLLQVGVVGFFLFRGNMGGTSSKREHVSETVTAIKNTLGAASSKGRSHGKHRGKDGMKRDRFLTTLNHIKNEIEEHRNVVE